MENLRRYIEFKVKRPGTHLEQVKGDLTCSRCWELGMSNRERTECPDLPAKPSVLIEGRLQVLLHLNARITLVVAAVGYLDFPKVPTDGVLPIRREECLGGRMSRLERSPHPELSHLEVNVVGILVQVSDDAQRVILGRNGRV